MYIFDVTNMDEADRFFFFFFFSVGYLHNEATNSKLRNGRQFKTCVTQMPLKASNPKMIKAAARTRKRFRHWSGQKRGGTKVQKLILFSSDIYILEFHTASELTRDPELFDVWHSVCLPGSISADSEWAQANAHTRRRMIMVTGQVRESGGLQHESSFLFTSDIVEFSSGPDLWCLTYFSLPESGDWILFVGVQKSVNCPKSF